MPERSDLERLPTISEQNFLSHFVKMNQPLLVYKGIEKWTALSLWSFDFFNRSFPNKIVKVASSKSSVFSLDKYHQKSCMQFNEMPLGQALSLIKDCNGRDDKYYLTHLPIKRYFPEIFRDFHLPAWLDPDKSYNENLWIGAKGNVTPLHFDEHNNLLIQITGSKLVRLYSPKESKSVFPYPVNKTVIENSLSGKREFYPFNHSQILNIDEPDLTLYRDFKNVTEIKTVINPGEVIFIPAGWWHQVHSLDDAISINISWAAKLSECIPSHILRFAANRSLWIGEFSGINKIINLSEFTNYLEVSRYLYRSGYYWLAVLFCMGFLQSVNNNIVKFNHSKNYLDHEITKQSLSNSDYDFINCLLDNVFSEQDDCYKDYEVTKLIQLVENIAKSFN